MLGARIGCLCRSARKEEWLTKCVHRQDISRTDVCGAEHECKDGCAMGHYCKCTGTPDGLLDYVCQGMRRPIYLRTQGNGVRVQGRETPH